MFHQYLLYRLLMEAESETRPQQVFCYKAGPETGRLHLEEKRKEGRSAVSLTVSLGGVARGFPGNPEVV